MRMRTWKWLTALLLVLTLRVGIAGEFQEGDILFQTSRSGQSVAIQRATRSPYSHMGIVLEHQGRLMLFEASATVRYTPIDTWIARGVGGRYEHKRLRAAERGLNPEWIARLRQEALNHAGKAYDLGFAWSDQRMYCSELVWKLYHALGVDLGDLRALSSFALDDPAVRAKLRERYGDAIPLREPVIAPSDIYAASLLIEVPH